MHFIAGSEKGCNWTQLCIDQTGIEKSKQKMGTPHPCYCFPAGKAWLNFPFMLQTLSTVLLLSQFLTVVTSRVALVMDTVWFQGHCGTTTAATADSHVSLLQLAVWTDPACGQQTQLLHWHQKRLVLLCQLLHRIQNRESLLSMNNIEICLMTAWKIQIK